MTRGKPLSFDRNEVLLKALDLFWEKGFAKTGITELLEHMGIQRQSFYNTFGSKEEVFIEALRFYGQNHISRISTIMEQDRHPLDNIKELFTCLLEANKRKERCGCLMLNTMSEFGDSNDRIGELVKEQSHNCYDVFLAAFTRAIQNNYISDTKDPKVLTTAYVTMIHGMTMLKKVGFSEEIIDEVLKATEELLNN